MGRLPWWRALLPGSLLVFLSSDDILIVEASICKRDHQMLDIEGGTINEGVLSQ